MKKINTVYFKNGLSELDIESNGCNLEIEDVFKKINNMQLQCNDVKDIIENLIICEKNQMSLNYNDVKSVLSAEGGAFVGISHASGEWSTTVALLEIVRAFSKHRELKEGANVILNVVGNKEIGIFEVNHALSCAGEYLDIEPEVYLGITLEESLVGEVYLVAIVTGL